MFINIITPCSRPENLYKISGSINIPKENYRWIVIFDMDDFPPSSLIPDNCDVYLHRNNQSIAGHAQRNFALDFIEKGHIYMNDDDTVIHNNLWENISSLDHDFIYFHQQNKNGDLRLTDNEVAVGKIDSHNFIVSHKLVGNDRWIINRYDADGYFASNMFNKVITNNDTYSFCFIPKVLSTYNSLR
jgi:hypothetical protein